MIRRVSKMIRTSTISTFGPLKDNYKTNADGAVLDYGHPLGKRKRDDLKMVAGACYLPKDDESKPRGEDAHFVCNEDQTIGVADGVGGWAKRGIDSGEYARELMDNSVKAIQDEPKGTVDPQRVLTQAYSKTKAKGASTACIITLKNHWLHAVNVGDSGFVVIRNGKVIYSSPAQQHSFNRPYQLGNSEKSDRPCSAEVIKVHVNLGDIIVAGSDGLFDNLYKGEIAEMVTKGINQKMQPEMLASMLAEEALYRSCDRYTSTPFMMASQNAGRVHHGGKIDDITVIVVYVIN